MLHAFAFDTCVILIHSFAVYERGKYIERVWPAEIPDLEIKKFPRLLDRLMHYDVYITPQILAEFHALVEGRLPKSEFLSFIKCYHGALEKMKEEHISKDELLSQKNSKHWKFCFTDTSLISLARSKQLAIITVDRPLKAYCSKIGIEAYHPYYDLYLNAELLS